MTSNFNDIDPSTLASRGAEQLDSLSKRMHNDSRNELHACRCGALVVCPSGHSAVQDDDKDVHCFDCDKPIGQKFLEAVR